MMQSDPLAEYLGVSLEGAHRAINDTRATAKVFVKMCEDVVKEGNCYEKGLII